ncbi:DUF1214 domain-containing protein [Colwelliaceae bacterium BS250]
MKKLLLSSIITASLALTACGTTTEQTTAPVTASASVEQKIMVTDENFIRADSNEQFAKYVKAFGAFGKFHHNRALYDLDNQITVRANLDTIYSFAVFDLSTPLTITMPNTDGKYQSLMSISQDHSITAFYEGTHTLTEESVGTRYVFLAVRTFVDPADKASLDIAHKLQDAVVYKQADIGEFSVPTYDEESLAATRSKYNALASELPTTRGFFGDIKDLDPTLHKYGAAYGWGGLAEKDAIYEGVTVEKNDGKTPYSVTVKDVPVDGFWSISVYNKDGYFTQNDAGINVLNGTTSEKNPDGSITINFGNPGAINNIDITEGWNYLIRQYVPGESLLSGEWKFPAATEVK